jgi:N-glycosyltransferase
VRVLCTIALSPSNTRALLPLVRALTRNHDVLVVSSRETASAFERESIPVRPLFENLADIALQGMKTGRVKVASGDPFGQGELVAKACGPHVTHAYRRLLAVAEEFRPDVVLRAGVEFTGLLVAETLGIPHVSGPSGEGQYLDPALAQAELNLRRAELDLPTSAAPESIHAHGRFDCLPPEYSFAAHDVAHTVAYRQPASGAPDESAPEWLTEVPADRPLVIVSLTHAFASVLHSTLLPRITDQFFDGLVVGHLFEEMLGSPEDIAAAAFAIVGGGERPVDVVLAALSTLDCSVVVATGGAPVGPVGDNVRVLDHLPQATLLETAQLLVTHGGYNSVREAVRAGVPMAVLPGIGDQRHNAERVEELGLGLRLADVSVDAVADACRRLLTDPAFTQRSRTARRHMLSLPTVTSAVAHLEHVAHVAGPVDAR